MKLIILDHLKRWRLVLVAIFITYFLILAFSTHEKNSQVSDNPTVASLQDMIHTVHGSFVFQAIMWLGFLLMWDIQRGLPRVLISLPLKAKQIGRAWWLASVAFPAIALGVVSVLAILFFSTGTNIIALLQSYFMNWLLTALYLGAAFGALTFMTLKWPDTSVGRARTFLINSLFGLTLFGFIFVQLGFLTPTKTTLIFAAYAVLFVLGWFRAERMVLQRASFRPAAQSSRGKPTQHKISQGFGGLPFLARRVFNQTTLFSFALFIWMTFATSFIFRNHTSHNQNLAQTIISMVNGGSIPYVFFVLVFSITPSVFQLRFLRTLPISSSNLAATFVFLPVISIATVGLIVAALASFIAGETLFLLILNSFLLLGAKAAIIVSLIVWRGLDALAYILIFLLVLSDSFISLGMTIIFHLGSNNPARPWWVNITIFLLCLAASFALTKRLLTKSSSAYRVRTMPANVWSMTRR